MAGIETNPRPLLALYLTEEKRLFDADPIVIVDIGARGGFNSEWAPIRSACRIFCFEADNAECERLIAKAPPGVTYIPRALAGKPGSVTLYETKLAASTGLYKTDMAYFGRLLNRDNGAVVAEHRVEATTLDNALREFGVTSVDFIKLDAEGAELDILYGGERLLESSPVLGVLSEVRYQQEINGSPAFGEFDSYLRQSGLRLYGLRALHQSRAVLPYPSLEDYRLPSGERFFAYTTRGQIQDGDAIYFRDLLIARNRLIFEAITPLNILKLAVLYEIYCLNDCAAELIFAAREKLAPIVDCERLLDLLASGLAGHELHYSDYVRQYFAPESRRRDLPSTVDRRDGDLDRIRSEIASIYSSTSWRITRPLRAFKRILENVRSAR